MDFDRIFDKFPSIGQFNRYLGLFDEAIVRDRVFESDSESFVTVAKNEWFVFADWREIATSQLVQYVQHLNKIVGEIREEGNGVAFRDWLDNLERQPTSNADALWSLVLACLNANHHLSVGRVDLGYAKHFLDPELSGEQAISYDDVRRHRIALRRFLKYDLKKMLPAGACKGMASGIKLEFGLDKGHHFHVLIVLNGDVVSKHAAISEMICRHWNETITSGKGCGYNCFRSTYAKPGIGSVRYCDEEKLAILEEIVVPYVTKPDFYIGMVKPDTHRSFWKSQPPKIKAKRRGRIRSKKGGGLPVPKPVDGFKIHTGKSAKHVNAPCCQTELTESQGSERCRVPIVPEDDGHNLGIAADS